MKNKKRWIRNVRNVSVLFLLASNFSNALIAKGEESTSISTVSSGQVNEIPEIKEAPTASHFFPEELKKWNPATDADSIHNVSKVPLAKRIKSEQTNKDQSLDAKVVSLAIANRNTSGTPSQGSSDKAVYNFTHWQYIDTMVAWAGSAGEGIIVPPSGDLTDSAHRNGVPVLGTVFFPPTAYGGKPEWVDQFVQKAADGSFPMADKLLELADYYGFDGWFINQETASNPTTAKAMKEFLAYLQAHKKPEMDIMWYDSMLENGSISWQGALNDRNKMYFQNNDKKVSDNMFLDFNWQYSPSKLASSAKKATELTRSPYDLFAGIDVQAQGFNTATKPSSIVVNGKPLVSLGLYCPDWTLRDGANYDIPTYWKNEEKFWVNSAGDPRDTSMQSNEWQGISRYHVEKSPVTSLPFTTNFNVGNGDRFYQNGNLSKEGTFNNRSIQDVMPTYRWILDNKGNQLKADIDYSDAFNGGSSISLTGSTIPQGETTMKLYKSELLLTGNEVAKIVSKGPAEMTLKLNFKNETAPVTIKGTTNAIGSWTETRFELNRFQNKTIDTISLTINGTTEASTKINLGQFAIQDETPLVVSPVENATIAGQSIEEDLYANLRLKWESKGDATSIYNIYRINEQGERQFEGSTANTAYYVTKQKRPSTNQLNYIIVPVDKNQLEHLDQASQVSFAFTDLQAPQASFTANKSFVKVGEKVTLTSTSSLSAEKLDWTIEGGTPDKSNEKQVETTFSKAGKYTIQLSASNQAGSTTATKENYITVYDDSFTEPLVNLSLTAINATASGFTSTNESPKQALDGKLQTKWCDNGNDHPWMMVDLGKLTSIIGFKTAHAEAGGENPEWNSRDYEILVSQDNQNWTQVVQREKNTAGVTEDTIPLTEARYVKLQLNKAEQTGKVARIYEFEILGFQKTGIEVLNN